MEVRFMVIAEVDCPADEPTREVEAAIHEVLTEILTEDLVGEIDGGAGGYTIKAWGVAPVPVDDLLGRNLDAARATFRGPS